MFLFLLEKTALPSDSSKYGVFVIKIFNIDPSCSELCAFKDSKSGANDLKFI